MGFLLGFMMAAAAKGPLVVVLGCSSLEGTSTISNAWWAVALSQCLKLLQALEVPQASQHCSKQQQLPAVQGVTYNWNGI